MQDAIIGHEARAYPRDILTIISPYVPFSTILSQVFRGYWKLWTSLSLKEGAADIVKRGSEAGWTSLGAFIFELLPDHLNLAFICHCEAKL